MNIEQDVKLAVVYPPGETLAEKLSELDMQVKEFARRCHMPEETIHSVIKGERRITPEMAERFERTLHIPARIWNGLQTMYDEYITRRPQHALSSTAN